MKYLFHSIDFHKFGDRGECKAQATDPNKPGLVLTLLLKGDEADRVWSQLLDQGDSVEVDVTGVQVVGVQVKGTPS